MIGIEKRTGKLAEELLPRKSKKPFWAAVRCVSEVVPRKKYGKATEDALLVYFDKKSIVVCVSNLWVYYLLLKPVIMLLILKKTST